ncbi:glucose/sorbosone dehydrogenase [Solirubrobacter pauli]|uniref:Glucose/sorbosone dehydrogenase n=1 Tax=Solirubrobacter pauli TaxID=166793 RepID=A0A660L3X1_9ACTN|nr:ThuA domain-containing protein [Solirubrobacter pauli]RKQ87552.1 glucose/sorbosone dehydrogenase [Solirubrobacter pauli]
MRGRWLWALLLTLALAVLGTGTAHAQSGPKVLVLKGADDATNRAAVAAIKSLGTANGFTAEDAVVADINSTKLAGYQSLIFVNVAGDVLDSAGENALQAYVEAGNGFLGIGSTATVEPGSSFVNGLIGARPSNNPTDAETKTLVAGDRVHPATRELPLQVNRSDLWYTWQTRPTGQVHTVARYRATNAAAGDGTSVGGTDHPISWCRDYRGGRSFYMGMGRTEGAWADANVTKHVLGAIQWTAGLVRADCKATINANYKGTKLLSSGATVTGLATSGESHGLSIADNGWVMYIGRGDCRTDAERGRLLNVPSFARVFSHADPNVGIGCGSVHIFDPKQYTGAENSGVTRAGTLAVYGDGGTGGERTDEGNHKMEYGLIGIAADPKFSENGYVYLQYFPTFNENTKPKGLPVERRISKMSQPRISRFTINRETKQLDLDSERIIFKYDAQIYSCCHVGGGMGFDSEGNLYVTTGDTNSSQNAGDPAVTGPLGYSGNNPIATCPEGPATEASSAHCGQAKYSYQDARRTAGNTNDYNGKMLRFNPREDIPAGADPGVGTTYDLPTAQSPNGPNLFDGKETEDGEGGKTKPEIYAMGLRNPSRLSIDPETDTPYTAWVGPDAQEPDALWGPSTYENAAQISHAGNYGWPYCMGSKQAYRDRLSNGAPRTDNPEGYVPGGPASGGTNGWYDCDNLRNDSPNNTGLKKFPHTTGTGADAGKVRGNNLWWSRGNKGGNDGCPQFPRSATAPDGKVAAPDYGATPTQGCPFVRNEGLTVMNGPVYRYKTTDDNSRRWPEYWDGRWFLHNNGGPSVKHGLLLDPDTDQNAGLPVWADSLRDTLSWGGSYMDSKFGPDGALYVQTYDGFFRAGTAIGIYRYDYVGGAPTPGANPRAFPIGDFSARFSSAGSGGKSFEWDFGDGSPKSTEANPTHKYADAKRYTATLKVTYADGGTDTKTVDVDVLSGKDDAKPVTTATLSPSAPDEAPNVYRRPVTLTLTAADPAGGSGVEKTEYRINGGDWTGYSAPIRRQQAGLYTVEFQSTDRTGNVEDVKSVAFEIKPANNCVPDLNDEFNAGPLNTAQWTVRRENTAAQSFEEGALRLKVRKGDMIGDEATAQNVLLKDAPSGSWQAQTKVDVSTLTDSGEQAGLVLWQSEKDAGGNNTFAKITYISKGSFSQYEWVATRNNSSDIQAGPQISAPDGDVYLRVSSDGDGTYIAEGSTNGESWQQIGPDITNLGDPETIKVGLKVSNGADSEHYAGFDWFRVDCSDRVAPRTTVETTGGQQGQLGWWTGAPTLALNANDGTRGAVDKVTYSVDGGAQRTYEGPFTVDTPGDHVVEYFATDKAGNVETAKRYLFRVDTAAPAIDASYEGDEGTGPLTVSLDTPDGDAGSGTVLTEYRVDGGPWTTYAATDERVLLDASESSLALWKQAGAGGFERLDDGSDGISPTPSDSLGMLWFKAQDFGDFRLKLQFREGRAEGDSNGGVFVRFPNPEQTPRTHECSKVGAAANDPAWVAINCGHEIQLYDGESGETRKTGSVYTFDNNGIEDIGVPKRGSWEDYEIEVVGQHYKISRNDEVINEWDNAPGLSSDRAGDPNTTLRQFTRGFIGLQNHGGDDRMQYRNVTIEDLSAGKPKAGDATGEFEVAGVGPHTVEVRATDEAGNVSRQTFDVEIGDSVAPGAGGATPQPLPLAPTSTLLPPMIDTPATYRLGSVTSRVTRATFAKRGVKIPVACTGAMDGSAKLTVSSATRKRLKLKRTTIDSESVKCWGPHSVQVTLKPSSTIAKALARKGGPKSVKLTVSVQMRDWGKPATTRTKTITLRR